ISESGSVLKDQPQIDQPNQTHGSNNQTGGPIANTPHANHPDEDDDLK
uniref:Uncharacterized protein n=1 Tax=Plectus sambesii TaxID=2011161 RepID=A0A914URI3_9BILA